MAKNKKRAQAKTSADTKKHNVGLTASGYRGHSGEDAPSERELFFRGLEFEDISARDEFLDEECKARPELLHAVRQLLEQHEGKSEFVIDQPLFQGKFSSAFTPGANRAGENFGNYTLDRQLGEGGMGEVWLAKQSEPIRRQVAVKLVRAGRETPGVLQRFEAERQALAAMDHPNIAGVLDAGSTPEGRPFFVMELVNGAPLNKYCDEARLTIRDRLQIFLQIAQAVSHAHQKAIIHRDLKPSNVLVTVIDGRPVAKVIDFGLAKAITGSLTTDSLATQFGAVLGTIEYMAPEQAGYSGQDVDTRADVYSMGVMLYELLTGLRPFDSEQIKNSSLDEMLRIVKEVEPKVPSTRLSSSNDAATNARLRKTDPEKLTSLLRNELDWIAMKALEKNRELRYQSAGEFADDIQRYLNQEPVRAHPQTRMYRFRKFVSRNKGLAVSIAAITTVLLMGIVGTSYGLFKSNANARLLTSNERLLKFEAQKSSDAEKLARRELAAAEKARKQAIASAEEERRQRRFAEAITDFVKDDFLALTTVQGQHRFQPDDETANVTSLPGKDATLKELLDRAGKKLSQRTDLEPLAKAELDFVVGVSYRQVGEYDLGVEFLESAVRIREQELGLEHESTINALNSLAIAYSSAGKNELSLETYQNALLASQSTLGESKRLTLKIMTNLAGHYLSIGESNEARKLTELALKICESNFDENDPITIACLIAQGESLCDERKWKEGIEFFERALTAHLSISNESEPETLDLMNTLGRAYNRVRQFDKGIEVLERCYKARAELFGEGDPATLTTCSYLSDAYSRTGQYKNAQPLLKKLLKYQRERYGNEHQVSQETTNSLAIASYRNGQYAEALELFQDLLVKRKTDFGADHPTTLEIMNSIAVVQRDLREFDQAIEMLNEILDIKIEKYGEDHVRSIDTLDTLASVYSESGQFEQAIEISKNIARTMEESLGADHMETLRLKRSLAYTYRLAGNYEEAIPIYQSTADIFAKKLGPAHAETISSLNGVANCLLLSENFPEAISTYQSMLDAIESVEGKQHRHYVMVVSNYAIALVRLKQFAEAIPLFESAWEVATEIWGETHPRTLKIMSDLGRANFEVGNSEMSIELLSAALEIGKRELGDDHALTTKISEDLATTRQKIEDAKTDTLESADDDPTQ